VEVLYSAANCSCSLTICLVWIDTAYRAQKLGSQGLAFRWWSRILVPVAIAVQAGTLILASALGMIWIDGVVLFVYSMGIAALFYLGARRVLGRGLCQMYILRDRPCCACCGGGVGGTKGGVLPENAIDKIGRNIAKLAARMFVLMVAGLSLVLMYQVGRSCPRLMHFRTPPLSGSCREMPCTHTDRCTHTNGLEHCS
jgi:hypothetical protein